MAVRREVVEAAPSLRLLKGAEAPIPLRAKKRSWLERALVKAMAPVAIYQDDRALVKAMVPVAMVHESVIEIKKDPDREGLAVGVIGAAFTAAFNCGKPDIETIGYTGLAVRSGYRLLTRPNST